MTTGDVLIRPYAPQDRERVRAICFQTGFMGEPVEWLWRDRTSFEDLFCGWWLEHRPGSAMVAELDGVVAGYLLGCEDTRQTANDGLVFFRHFARRACCLRPGTAGTMWRMLGDGVLDGIRKQLPPVRVWDERWPAHLHIDLLPECRGRGVGSGLVRSWLDSLRRLGVPGCHLQTMAENSGAIAFFESMGFRRLGQPSMAPGFRTPDGARMHVQLMVQPLEVTEAP
jgi:ribosomal protein S18 acetylase RimI-like enzyme